MIGQKKELTDRASFLRTPKEIGKKVIKASTAAIAKVVKSTPARAQKWELVDLAETSFSKWAYNERPVCDEGGYVVWRDI